MDGSRTAASHARAALAGDRAAHLAASGLNVRASHQSGSTTKDPGINNNTKYAQYFPARGAACRRLNMANSLMIAVADNLECLTR
jgi:hypothetical protein